jgi:hypothetical protein
MSKYGGLVKDNFENAKVDNLSNFSLPLHSAQISN